MKTNKLLFLIAFAVTTLLTSCGNNEKAQTASNQMENKDSNILKVKIEGIFEHNDRLQLFYSNDEVFIESESILKPIYGQPTMQTIVFEVPKNKKPENLRLDLGQNSLQSKIVIKNISFEFNDKIVDRGDEKFREYFGDTEFTVYDPVKMVYNCNLNTENIFDPMLISTPDLKTDLQKVYQNK